MTDSYQAIYDAVRSRISGGDLSEAARQAFDISFYMGQVQASFQEVAAEMSRPSVVFKPTILQDGDAWLAILGDLPTGVVGCGKTPSAAMYDFDMAWHREAKAPPRHDASDLLEAARAMMLRWPTDQHQDSPLYDEAIALRAAISKAESTS